MSIVDPSVTSTAITCLIVMLVAVVLETLDRMVGRREYMNLEQMKNGNNNKVKEKTD